MDAVAKKRARPAARRASASARADRANPRDTPRDPLAPYRRKRDFSVTAEPPGELAGELAKQPTASFCVQEHAASRLHYDFRLELDGVLKSWAVPKGPSLDPREKRLAVAVEDHPVEYGTFEGVIPEGEYGGGAVLLWDRGLWEPLDDPERGLARGKLDFVLHGEKLAGRFALIKLKNSDSEWLLVKADDERARRGRDLLAEQPRSVASGRTIEDIARDEGATPKQLERARAAAASDRPATASARPPAFVPPQLATLVTAAPQGEQWLHEIKLDGYRMQCRIEHGEIHWASRNDVSWDKRLALLTTAALRLPVASAILDGELVIFDEHGRSSFTALKNALGHAPVRGVVYQAFDLLHLDGRDLRSEPLERRKQLLRELFRDPTAATAVRFTDHVRGSGPDVFTEACRLGVEGIVAKRADLPYRSGRSTEWLKVKCHMRQELIVVGFTPPTHARDRLGALVLAVRDGGDLRDGDALRYAGRVGTGFSQEDRRQLRERLDVLVIDRCPLAVRPRERGLAHVRWVEPELVAEIEFTEWTEDGRLRHPSFQGLREDKRASEVVREKPSPSAAGASVAGVVLGNADKVLFAESSVTKLDLARYYEAVAERILPHVRDRPLTLVRCPDGSAGPCFYQKHVSAGMGPQIETVDIVEDKGKTGKYLVVSTLAGIVAAVQLGALELHVWGSRQDDLARPDRLVFDLDPDPSVPFAEVRRAAADVRDRLEAVGLASFAMVTGGKGLHVVVPLQRTRDFTEVKAFAHGFARAMVADEPRRFVAVATKAKRTGRIFVDYLRNSRGATAIAPYSTRRRPNAPVAAPVEWDELDELESAAPWDLREVGNQVAKRRKDPWAEYWDARQRITNAAMKAVGLAPA